MTNARVDVVLISPSNAKVTYQSLAEDYSAIEPPTWALLLAESVRSLGWNPKIIDALAENLSDIQVLERVREYNPRLICFVVYGQNVNSGTTNMSGATRCSTLLKQFLPHIQISFLGSYMQALPIKVLQEEPSIDFVFTNEGVYALQNILKLQSFVEHNLKDIRGIAWRNRTSIVINKSEIIVPNERMDKDLPGYAWDLLPFRESPLDLYRSPLWHAEYDQFKRTPYAAIQTSLGCNFACDFCMINTINRNDEAEVGVSGKYSKMRFWSTDFILNQFDLLASLGVRTIRIVDEMFLLYKKHYIPLCEKLAERPYSSDLRMWAYSRVDTVTNPEFLSLVRKSGIKWLALGIESAERSIRLEVSKGKFQDVDIKDVVNQIHQADIDVMANYIVGLPGDSIESMQKTFDLSMNLCTSGWNMYPAMPLPGSQLYKTALDRNLMLPADYSAYSFHSYETQPFETEHLSGAQILSFRDSAFHRYHESDEFLHHISKRFGAEAAKSVIKMSKVKLRRKLIEEQDSSQN